MNKTKGKKPVISRLIRSLKLAYIRLLRSHSGPHQISLGMVLGFFPCWFPTFGVGAFFSVTLAKLFRANIAASLFAAAVGSFTWPALFYLNYKIGFWVKDLLTPTKQIEVETDITDIDYVETIEEIRTWVDIGIDFTIGAVFNSIVFTILFYYILYFIVGKYQRVLLQRWKQRYDKPDQRI